MPSEGGRASLNRSLSPLSFMACLMPAAPLCSALLCSVCAVSAPPSSSSFPCDFGHAPTDMWDLKRKREEEEEEGSVSVSACDEMRRSHSQD